MVLGLGSGKADQLAGGTVSLLAVDPKAALAAALHRPGADATELAGQETLLRLLVCPNNSTRASASSGTAR